MQELAAIDQTNDDERLTDEEISGGVNYFPLPQHTARDGKKDQPMPEREHAKSG